MKRAPASWDELEKETVLVRQLINRMPEEEWVGAATRLCFEAALWAGGYDG